MEKKFAKKTANAALWQVMGGGWQTIVRLGASLFLARALSPSDFGLFGMVLIAQEFVAYIGAIGMNAGVIAKKEVVDNDVYTFFWSTAFIRCVMYLISFVAAPLFASFFNEPELSPLLRVSTIVFLITIFEVVPQTLLMKALDFKYLNIAKGISVSIESITAIVLVFYFNFTYWGLCYAMVFSSVVYVGIIWSYSGWVPKLIFNKNSFSYLFRYGINGLGFSIVTYINNNIDYLLIGKILGSRMLGLYEFAYKIPHLIYARIAQPISSIVFPSISLIQDDDSKMSYFFETTVYSVSFMIFPVLFGMASLADKLVPLLWGDQWLSIVYPMQVLCLCAILRCIPQGIGAVFHCKNRPDLIFKISAVGLIWSLFWIASLGAKWGINGVAWAMVLSVFPSYINLILAYKMMKKRIWHLFIKLYPVVSANIICFFVFIILKKYTFLQGDKNYIISISLCLLYPLVYLLIIRVLFSSVYFEVLSVLGNIDSFKKLRLAFFSSKT